MFNELFILFGASFATGFGGWFFGRRKNKADATAAEIGNLDRIINMWQKTAEQFKKSYDELQEQNGRISDELKALREENKDLVHDVKRLNRLVEDLKCENKGLIRRLNEIKRFQQLKSEDLQHENQQPRTGTDKDA